MATSYYSTGTVSLTNGSAVVIGNGTGWQLALISGGNVIVQAPGNVLPIASVDSDSQITAELEWTGATGEYAYTIQRDTAYLQSLDQNSQNLSFLLSELRSGTIFKYDQSGDLAGRDLYDARPKNFGYLVSIGVEQPLFYVKASSAEGDWAGPFPYGTGPQGEKGDTGDPGPYTAITVGEVTTLNPGTPATVTPVEVAPGVIELEFGIPRGVNGTGTGDVVGPASSSDGAFVVFSGTDGKGIKEASVSEVKDALDYAAGEIAFDNTLTELEGNPATVQAALEAVVEAIPTGGGSGANDAVFALEIADLKGSRVGMVGGVADPFDDETGVDTAAAVNHTYDAANDWYLPATPSTGTSATGSNAAATSAFTMLHRGYTLVTGAKIKSVGIYSGTAQNLTIVIGRRVSASVYDILATYTYAHNGSGWHDYQLPTPFEVPSGTIHAGSVHPTSGTNNLVSAPRSWKSGAQPVGDGNSGFTEDTGNIVPVRVQYLAGNMTLPSVAYTAAVQPTTGRLAIQTVETDAITINTDLIAEMSRDGGTTWTAAALAQSTALGTIKMYEASVDLSTQPAGTSMKWRARTANNKTVAVSGVVMQWS